VEEEEEEEEKGVSSCGRQKVYRAAAFLPLPLLLLLLHIGISRSSHFFEEQCEEKKRWSWRGKKRA